MGATAVSCLRIVTVWHSFQAIHTQTQFILRPTPKAAHNKLSNTWTVLISHTAVSLPEGFRNCLSCMCCEDSEGGPSTAGLVVTSACNWVQTARKICAKNAFLSLSFFSLSYSFVSSWFILQYDTAHWDCYCNILQFPALFCVCVHHSATDSLHCSTIIHTVIPRLTKIIRSGITFVSRNLR